MPISIEDYAALQREARIEAAEDALARASQLAEVLGVKVGKPVRISEGYDRVNVREEQTVSFKYSIAAGAEAPQMPVSEGETTVAVNIHVVFAIAE